MAKKKKPKRRPESIIEGEVRELMKKSPLTTYRIGKLSGISLPAIYRFYNGLRRMEFHTLEKLLDALGCELCIKRKK